MMKDVVDLRLPGEDRTGQISLVCNSESAGLGRTREACSRRVWERLRVLDRPAISGKAVRLDATRRRAVSRRAILAFQATGDTRRPNRHQLVSKR
jgi:hypothetical protein